VVRQQRVKCCGSPFAPACPKIEQRQKCFTHQPLKAAAQGMRTVLCTDSGDKQLSADCFRGRLHCSPRPVQRYCLRCLANRPDRWQRQPFRRGSTSNARTRFCSRKPAARHGVPQGATGYWAPKKKCPAGAGQKAPSTAGTEQTTFASASCRLPRVAKAVAARPRWLTQLVAASR
jgi:hypothetical protein